MIDTPSGKVPFSFWIVSGLSLLWNAFGGVLYIMTQRRDPSVMEGTPEAVLRGLETMPVLGGIGLCRRRLGLAHRFGAAGAALTPCRQCLSGIADWRAGQLWLSVQCRHGAEPGDASSNHRDCHLPVVVCKTLCRTGNY